MVPERVLLDVFFGFEFSLPAAPIDPAPRARLPFDLKSRPTPEYSMYRKSKLSTGETSSIFFPGSNLGIHESFLLLLDAS